MPLSLKHRITASCAGALFLASGAIARDAVSTLSFLDNGTVRLGVDLSIGGAITYFADARKGVNMVNSHDWGRQIQMSFYSGPRPFEPNGKKPRPHWAGLGWNPIQSGDVAGNRSKVIEHRNDGREIYVKCIPMHWPLNDVPGVCTFESTIRLKGRAALVHSRLTNQRLDKTQYAARSQELPAIYSNGPWHRLMTYTGSRPFTGEPVVEIPKKRVKPGDFPWSQFPATENWAALVDEKGNGFGVWTPGAYNFLGGFAGKPGAGGPKDAPTGYIAPMQNEILDHNIRYDYSYRLIVGSTGEIRAYVRKNARKPANVFEFQSDRQHWTYRNATDTGWPIKGALHVKLERDNPQLLSPNGCWPSESISRVDITAAFSTGENVARLSWRCIPAQPNPGAIEFAVQPDGEMRTYSVALAGRPGFAGALRQIIIAPCRKGGADRYVKVKRVALVPRATRREPATP